MAFRESSVAPFGGVGGIMMSGDGGPMMSGTWVNPRTGHKFTVADCFFQDGNFMVKTTDGRMLDYNTIQHYVQTTDKGPEIGKQPSRPQPAKKKAAPIEESIPDEIMNQILPEDMEAIGLGNIAEPRPTPSQVAVPEAPRNINNVQDPDQAMIERVLKKHSLPKPSVSIDWQPVPTKQIETLVDILGVDPKNIAEYYVSKLNTEELINCVKDSIVNCVLTIAGQEDKPEAALLITEPIVEDEPEKEKPAKPKKKTTKKKK